MIDVVQIDSVLDSFRLTLHFCILLVHNALQQRLFFPIPHW